MGLHEDLVSEFSVDPIARGYDAMDDAERYASLQVVDRTTPKTSLTSSEVFNAIDTAEYNAIADEADKAMVWQLLALGTLNPYGKEKDLIVQLFGGGSNTVANLQAARVTACDRIVEIGLGTVRLGNVIAART